MRSPGTWLALEELGRARLSRHFYARDMLHSEIGNFFGIPNIPENPDLFLAAGRALCENLLDPLTETFGPIAVRSAYRSPSLNQYGATQVRPQKCAANDKNHAGHIWDRRDAKGRMGATASIVIPWFADHYAQGRDWRHLAWWLHDHLTFHEVYFFPKLAAFNLGWREEPERRILSYIAPKGHLALIPPDRADSYADFPPFRGINYPEGPLQ